MTLTITLVKEPGGESVVAQGVTQESLGAHPMGAALAATDFEAKVGQARLVPVAGEPGDAVLLVGLGADGDRTVDSFRTAGGALARAARSLASLDVTDVLEAAGELGAAAVAQALAEGLVLGTYRYTALKSEPEPSSLRQVDVVGKGGKPVQGAFDTGAAVAEAVCVTRDLVNEPGGSLTPPVFAKKVQQLGQRFGFEVEVLDEKAIKAAKMGGLLGVNRGSEQPPRFLQLTWTPAGAARGAVALVGKGVTFDSGGLSLKPSDAMMWMKGDMAGAGAVVGTFCGLAATNPRVEVRGYLPLTDNMTGGDATRLGDVLTISNGKTVEIHNTDAEGRLILADALSKASADGADAIIDVATLTGACMVALGDDHAGVMGRNESWIDQVTDAAAVTGEQVWQLPLPTGWRSQLDSDIADLKNIGGRYGGASLAGLFLEEFVGDGIPWVHLDIAGPAFVEKESPTQTKGGTGFAVRMLLQVLKQYKRPARTAS